MTDCAKGEFEGRDGGDCLSSLLGAGFCVLVGFGFRFDSSGLDFLVTHADGSAFFGRGVFGFKAGQLRQNPSGKFEIAL